MTLTILVHGTADPAASYLTWAPAPLTLALAESAPRAVRVRSESAPGGGRLQFRIAPSVPLADVVDVTLPPNAGLVALEVAGKFPHPSTSDRDVAIVVEDRATGAELGRKPVMVRVRKNANDLSASERDRFLSALVRLNMPDASGVVPFLDIQNMHTELTDPEIHQRSSFLPWHRAFILDLERRLQRIDPSVAVPYWRFDLPAPNVFTRDFVGVPLSSGVVDFTATNPLVNWRNRLAGSGNPRVRRYNIARVRDPAGEVRLVPFDPRTQRAAAISNGQDDTINLGKPPGSATHRFDDFGVMEIDPHGAAHVSFIGQIAFPSTAPADPLFFMLHCNVDRLWARWQWLAKRHSSSQVESYPHVGDGDPALGGQGGIGDYTRDTMWPWNGAVTPPRPGTAPGGPFPTLAHLGPSATPTVGAMLDYQGLLGGVGLGFSYSDIPYES
ncbi:tyrosinase family protein [Sandaracinus amylolyticus]|uniref:Tyrosinase n=1 Tax=Sandaracinus amylolyticus TaxID=927083 RepID=A0A0F6YHH7_9BACT|nr:tyrosinase family protein [Sandaracinus amylolyticus]AKF04035.1 Tyrosinase [Sandaracinus amylolyticus]